MSDETPNIDPEDHRALKAIHKAFSDELLDMYENWVKRVNFFTGVPVRAPVVGPSGDHGKWLEVRVLDVSEVLHDGLEKWSK